MVFWKELLTRLSELISQFSVLMAPGGSGMLLVKLIRIIGVPGTLADLEIPGQRTEYVRVYGCVNG